MSLNNVLIKKSEEGSELRVVLIDLDNCSDYKTADGKHIPSEGTEKNFRGNLAMASVNAMNYKKLSRRDDFISLSYMLIYMIQGSLSFVA